MASNKLLPWVSGTEQDLNVPFKQNKVGLCEKQQAFSSTKCSVMEKSKTRRKGRGRFEGKVESESSD